MGLVIRILAIVGGITLLYFILKAFSKPDNFKKCSRCEGKGFWYDARGKEICDWCKGSGKLPKDF